MTNSAIGWIDFSSEHRAKVQTVLDLLGTPDVLDELGIGAIRDSFSDTLFPGISTIQTRAKYFLTIPRILLDYARLPLPVRRRRPLFDYLREQENHVAACLDRNHRGDPQDGIIGVRFVGKRGELQRKPSSVYWTGLRTFGLVSTSLSLREFVRKFGDADTPTVDLVEPTSDAKGDDPNVGGTDATVVTAAYSGGWEEGVTLHLSFDEATFLARQIETRVPHSLLGQILMDDGIRSTVVGLPGGWGFREFYDAALFIDRLNPELQRACAAARDFWDLLEGAHIRYNVGLQAHYGTLERQREFEDRWEEWRSRIKRFPWYRWDTTFLWELARRHRHRIQPFTQRFVERWIEAVRGGAEPSADLDELVARQERLNKGARARLKESGDERVSGWIGIDRLDYRLPQARTIITDIHQGLSRAEAGDA